MTTFASTMVRHESRAVVHIRRALLAVVCIYMVSFCWSMYRRIRQVLRIEARVSSVVVVPGSTVGYDVITSGEVQNRITLELVQGEHREVLHEQRGGVHKVRSLDPRLFRYTPTVVITLAILARFQPGPATLRVTGFGGQKLLRTPAPRVREVQIRLQQ